MNGKKAKILRRIARGLTTEHTKEMVEVRGTSRIRTSVSGNKTKTVTLAHPMNSYRNMLKLVKRDAIYPFNPEENNHACVS
ncbi:hypothetical protein KIT04_085 [Vibrio phage KIT04]|nr:hypothetical protein KIT04_085 [Vibrio phage KIT04]